MTKILISPPSTPGTGVADYVSAVERAGGTPVLSHMPISGQVDWDAFARREISGADGVLLIGGPDIDPEIFGVHERHETVHVNPKRDGADLALARAALGMRKPILAICRGVQVLAVALGGTLVQHIPAEVGAQINHQTKEPPEPHTVDVAGGTLLHDIIGADSLPVTSRHHQCVRNVPDEMTVSAVSPDGVIEALELKDRRPVIGVQWHPETVAAARPKHQALFSWLVREAGKQ